VELGQNGIGWGKLAHHLILSPMAAMHPTPQLRIGEPSSSDGKVLAKACPQEGVRFLFGGRMSPTALSILGRAAPLEIEQPVVSLTTSMRRRPALCGCRGRHSPQL
jgi:hypothetical protein